LHDDDGVGLRLDAAEAAPSKDAEEKAKNETDVPLTALRRA
jgi:hypothetical protein